MMFYLRLMLLGLFFAHPAWAGDCVPSVLAKRYAQMLVGDQALRGRYIAILEKEHRKERIDAKEKEALEERIWNGDEANRKALDETIARCGWPGTLDGKRAA